MDAFSFQSQAGVLLVALLRTALAGLLLFCLSHYKFSLLSAEHARRYQNLLLLISELNGEVVLMQKGTHMIEDTMSTAYRLYHDMSERNIDESLTRTALQIARDVHEIKKDYNLIVRGLSSSMKVNSENDGMSLDDILTILKSSLDASLPKGKRLSFNIQLEENLYTQNHYLLLSIFRNLFNNAIEATNGNLVELSVRQSSTDSSYVIEVEDHGPGIDPEDMEQIFEQRSSMYRVSWPWDSALSMGTMMLRRRNRPRSPRCPSRCPSSGCRTWSPAGNAPRTVRTRARR